MSNGQYQISVQKRSVDLVTAKHEMQKMAIREAPELNNYEKLFNNMGIMDNAKGHWLDCLGTEDKPNYRVTRFKLSDSLSYLDFHKNVDYIKEKIKVEYLEIYTENGNMCFRIRKETLSMVEFKYLKSEKNLIPVGVDLDNEIIYTDIIKDPHMLVSGMSNSGKSTLLNMIILHIVMNDMGDMHLIDLKDGVELFQFRNLKQVKNFAYDLEDAKRVIAYFKEESQKRFVMLREKGYRNYEEYIADNPDSTLRREFLIVDEIADLMLLNEPKTKKEKAKGFDAIQEMITLGRKCRAVGMHLICSTQKPTADSLPTQLRAQLGCIIGFRQTSQVNSHIVIDEKGLEELENRHCIGIIKGEKIQFRTMNLDKDFAKKVINSNQRKFEQDNKKEDVNPEDVAND